MRKRKNDVAGSGTIRVRISDKEKVSREEKRIIG